MPKNHALLVWFLLLTGIGLKGIYDEESIINTR